MEECFNFGAIIRGKNDYPLEKFLPFMQRKGTQMLGDQRRRNTTTCQAMVEFS